MLNSLTVQELMREVGEKGLNELRNLDLWLRFEAGKNRVILNSPPFSPHPTWRFRYAPSIVTRSEAELFGLSMPRFAIRVYLANKRNFINLRRTAVFCDQARSWGKPPASCKQSASQALIREKPTWLRPAWYVRNNSCIGDSCLQPPQRFGKDYHFIEVELGLQYGEGEVGFKGIPYVKQIPLSGGGLCAQAVCFMATTLLHRFAKGVHGVAEITALTENDEKAYVELGGLPVSKFRCYFEKPEVGLRALPQRPPATSLQFERDFTWAMRSYVLSNMPVILPMDGGLMAGVGSQTASSDSIFRENGLCPSLIAGLDEECRRSHAVLVVGCDKDAQSRKFVFHDPSQFPFMKGRSSQIINAGIFTDTSLTTVIGGLFVPVTPNNVRLPLIQTYVPTDKGEDLGEFGLHDVASFLDRVWFPSLYHGHTNAGGDRHQYDHGSCFLGNLSKTDTTHGLKKFAGIAKPTQIVVANNVEAWLETFVQTCAPENGHWCWLQIRSESVWLWDAEVPVDDPSVMDPTNCERAAQKHLMAVLWVSPAGELKKWRRETAAAETDQQSPERSPITREAGERKKSLFTMSLITSFERRFDKVLMDWPDKKVGAELYTFMQEDATAHLGGCARLFIEQMWHFICFNWLHAVSNGKRRISDRIWPVLDRAPLPNWLKKRMTRGQICWPICTALDRAALCMRMKCFRKFVSKCEKANLRIMGIASFFPGLADPPSSKRSKRAIKAVGNLLKFGAFLKQEAHEIDTVEIVAGSLINGIWPAEVIVKEHVTDHVTEVKYWKEVYVANKLNRRDAMLQLVKSLGVLVKEAEASGIQLAVEFEPGPLYVLGNWQAIVEFCELVEAEPALCRWVGLNLDIAHWGFLHGITPGQIRSTPIVMNRIVHCHISDHGRGHFGDVALGLIHGEKEFAEWFDLLEEIASESRPDTHAKFSKRIAIEQESCKSLDSIKKGVSYLRMFPKSGPRAWN